MSMEPRAHLNAALALADDDELVIECGSVVAARRYTYRLRGVMAEGSRQSKKDLTTDDPDWGTHPWERVAITLDGEDVILRRDPPPMAKVRKRTTVYV